MQGRFEILSLSGSFTITENSGARSSRTGGISVSLAGPDGRVVGGGVAGLLLAASPIQVPARFDSLDVLNSIKLASYYVIILVCITSLQDTTYIPK